MAMDGGLSGLARDHAPRPGEDQPVFASRPFYVPMTPLPLRPGRAPDILDTFCPADGSAAAAMAWALVTPMA